MALGRVKGMNVHVVWICHYPCHSALAIPHFLSQIRRVRGSLQGENTFLEWVWWENRGLRADFKTSPPSSLCYTSFGLSCTFEISGCEWVPVVWVCTFLLTAFPFPTVYRMLYPSWTPSPHGLWGCLRAISMCVVCVCTVCVVCAYCVCVCVHSSCVGSIPGLERSPAEGITIHSSILAWRIPLTEKPGGLQSIELHRVDTTEVT